MITVYTTHNDASDCAAMLCFNRYEYHCIEDIGEPYRRIVELIDAADGTLHGVGMCLRSADGKHVTYYIAKDVLCATI